MQPFIRVIGAGLAGCEAAWQIAKRKIPVQIVEMKPNKYSAAHHLPTYAELVCSNSLRSDQLENAVGLLKEEMRLGDSLIIKTADSTRVPAGSALAVDRAAFSRAIYKQILEHPLIAVTELEVQSIPNDDIITIVATGPLTDGALYENIRNQFGKEYLHFFDASAPIVNADTIDMSKAFRASRYGRGDDDYINCPMNQEEYEQFVTELLSAQCAQLHGFETENVFEGCMPVEVMAKRGIDTLRFGPLKPVGLVNPSTGAEAYAVVQLRQDNQEGTLYNMVGFQTHLKFGEQIRVFGMIPALSNAEFSRFGVMHRNTFIHSPSILNACFQVKQNPQLYFAGQLTGVEGYVESAASGMLAGIYASLQYQGLPMPQFSRDTALGALANYISNETIRDFQPMNINFGLFEKLDPPVGQRKFKSKLEKIRPWQKDPLRKYAKPL